MIQHPNLLRTRSVSKLRENNSNNTGISKFQKYLLKTNQNLFQDNQKNSRFGLNLNEKNLRNSGTSTIQQFVLNKEDNIDMLKRQFEEQKGQIDLLEYEQDMRDKLQIENKELL